MPETKEEMFALVHEFDDRVEGMMKCIRDFINKMTDEDFGTLDWALLMVYYHNLKDLRDTYNYIDNALSNEMHQNGES